MSKPDGMYKRKFKLLADRDLQQQGTAYVPVLIVNSIQRDTMESGALSNIKSFSLSIS